MHTVKFPTTVGLMPKGGRVPAKALSAAKRRSAAELSQDELLAKINALDWDLTISPDDSSGGAATPYPAGSTSMRWVAVIVAVLICALGILYFVFSPSPRKQPAEPASAPIAATTEANAPAIAQQPAAATQESLEAVAAAEERRKALYDEAVHQAEVEANQKAERRAERQRKLREAREAERASLAAQRDNERRQQEEAARLRAQREAEEAARAAKAREQAAAPKAPGSPQEMCAGAGNVFSRGLCESRACGQAEWHNHPFCRKRVEDQLRSLGGGGG